MPEDDKDKDGIKRFILPGEEVNILWTFSLLGGGFTLGVLGWFVELKIVMLAGILTLAAGVYLGAAKVWKWYNTPKAELALMAAGETSKGITNARNGIGDLLFGWTGFWHSIPDEEHFEIDPKTGEKHKIKDCKIIHSKFGFLPILGAADIMQYLYCRFSD